MQRKLRIYYTSDTHGFFSPIDYATGGSVDSGLANCMSNFQHSGNTLVIDGGDTLQGSPFTYWLYSQHRDGDCVPARLLNLGGYDFITLGNHDFNYGKAEIERFLDALGAKCLCANVEGIRGVEKTAVITLEKRTAHRADRYCNALCKPLGDARQPLRNKNRRYLFRGEIGAGRAEGAECRPDGMYLSRRV